jgi:hypothetical protein
MRSSVPKNRAAHLFLTVVATLLLPLAAGAQSGIEGDWKGSFEVDGTTLRLVLHIKPAPSGGLVATLDSVDQDSPNIPVSSITFESTTLKLDVAQVNGSFEGKLSKDGDEIKGHWTEGKRRALNFRRVTDSTKIKPPIPIGGDWEGTLIAGGRRSQIVLHLDAEHYTKLSASLDGIDEMSNGTLVNQTSFTDNALRLSIDAVHASYFGAVSEDGNEIEGVWTQGQSFPLTFRRSPATAKPVAVPTNPNDQPV